MAAPTARQRERGARDRARVRRGVRPGGVGEIEKAAARIEAATASIPQPGSTKAGLRQAVKAVGAGQRKGAAFQMGPVQPVGRRFINMMLYGGYGFGKTTFAGSADDVASMRDVLFVNADSGTMSLTSRTTMDFVDVSHYDQVARIYEFLVIHIYWRDQLLTNPEEAKKQLLDLEKEFKANAIPIEDQIVLDDWPADPERTWFVEQRLRSGRPMDEPFIYRTVIFDSLSEIHKYLVYKFTGVDLNVVDLSEEVEKMESWQPAQELFRLFIRSMRQLAINSIFVCAEEMGTRNESDRKKGRRPGVAYPKLAGQMAGDVAGFVDIVGYLDKEVDEEGGKTKRYLYLGAGYEGWISKHRFENLPDLDYLEDPTISSLLDLARKDAEAHGTSGTRSSSPVVTVAPSVKRAQPVTAQRRVSAANPSSGSRSSGGARRGRDSVRRVR